jgi:DNA-nicking Smr family endonuclease
MRRLTPDDIGLWRRAMHDVAPLPGRNISVAMERRHPAGNAGETSAPPTRPAAPPPHPVTPAQPAPPLDRLAGIDRANAERLRRGQRPIEARLDLHGLTQAEAHQALARFVSSSRAAGRRCVLVITGHGRFSGGVLKQAVPRWLNEAGLRQHLLAIAPAQPQHGGSGALYVLLRRFKSSELGNALL